MTNIELAKARGAKVSAEHRHADDPLIAMDTKGLDAYTQAVRADERARGVPAMPEFARYEVRRGVLLQADAGRFLFYKEVKAAWPAAPTPPAAMVPLSDDRHTAIGLAVERACEALPEGYEVCIELENGAGTVRLYGPERDVIDAEICDEPFYARISHAVDVAIAHGIGTQGEAL